MFHIVRTTNEKVEFLKDSSSQFAKSFSTSQAADRFCKKLNKSVTIDKQWSVAQY
ncbi:hypothetical protein H0266_15440 [Halobacillus locisalis]|uniref:Uncharacterized protein n=1 Tax=Halobacillus locisalis TaxID=220753 RepID=A0A838CWK2_9BACI|nr:hypothetical protein [Halobacillus locisalis]MBA2176291.1 hypothetical protein [Halobacillus locisalis]